MPRMPNPKHPWAACGLRGMDCGTQRRRHPPGRSSRQPRLQPELCMGFVPQPADLLHLLPVFVQNEFCLRYCFMSVSYCVYAADLTQFFSFTFLSPNLLKKNMDQSFVLSFSLTAWMLCIFIHEPLQSVCMRMSSWMHTSVRTHIHILLQCIWSYKATGCQQTSGCIAWSSK